MDDYNGLKFYLQNHNGDLDQLPEELARLVLRDPACQRLWEEVKAGDGLLHKMRDAYLPDEDPDFVADVLIGVSKPAKLKAPATTSSPLRPWMLVAAALIIIIGIAAFKQIRHSGNAAQAPPDTATSVTISPPFSLVNTFEAGENQRGAIIETNGTADLGVYYQGYTLAGYYVTAIGDNEVLLAPTDQEGQALTVVPGNVIAPEIQKYSRKWHRGQSLSAIEMERLGNWSVNGYTGAIKLLDNIALRPGDPHAEQAKTILGGTKGLKAVAALIKQVKDESNRYRANLIHGLAETGAPRGLAMLRSIAVNSADNCQIHAIRALRECGDRASLPALKSLSTSTAATPDIRQEALRAFEQLSKN
ncbi:HEAT repeat domain-containing protein [Planctomycetota bacterium]